MRYTDHYSGISFQLNHPFTVRLAQNFEAYASSQRAWVEMLRSKGVKLAHPDDGWVNREANEISPCYPEFDDSPGASDVIALGDWKRYRLVEVVSIRKSMFGLTHYKFKPA